MSSTNKLMNDSEESSLETHFVERSDDAETLWEVEEIIDERPRFYRVRWVGVDDKGDPWPLDWVPKGDCTDTLVRAWKRKRAEKKKKRKQPKQTGRKSIQSRGSTVSTSTKVSEGSSSTVTNVLASRPGNGKPVTGSKRKNDERDQKPNSPTVAPEIVSDALTSGRPKKKRKIVVELSSPGEPSTSKLVNPDVPARKDNDQTSIRHTNTKHHAPRPRTSNAHYESSSDDEPSPKPASKFIYPAPRRAVDSKSQANRPTSMKSSKRVAQEESEEDEEIPTVQLPRKNQNGSLKKSKPSDTSTSRASVPKRQPTHKEAVSTRSPPNPPPRASGSHSSIPTGPDAVAPPEIPPKPTRRTSPLFLPSFSHSRSTSLETAEKADATDEAADILIDALAQPKDDEDSALEYADYPLLEAHPPSPTPPPPAQPKPALQFRSPSTSQSLPSLPSPGISKGKGRALEPEFVPETEGEESQGSQRPSLELRRSPSKNSIIARMRPRTPGSKRNAADADIIASPLPFNEPRSKSPQLRPPRKPLHPIPQLSPSKFANLPSTIESVEPGGDDESSIEQFDSPDKQSHLTKMKRRGKDGTLQEHTDSSVNSSLAVPSAARDVINKGVALADAAKRAKQNLIFAQVKVPLTNILEKERERSRAPEVQVKNDEEEVVSQNQEGAEPTTSEKIAFADSLVDYEGGMGDVVVADSSSRTQDTSKNVAANLQAEKVYLRQEEEESTQDLLAELQEQRPVPDVSEGWAYPVPAPMDSMDEDAVNVIDSLEVAPKSSGPLPETSQDDSVLPSNPPPVKRSPSPSLDSSLVIPATLSPTRPEQPTVAPLQTVTAEEGNSNHHLDSAMNLLNKKSEEIARLENLLAGARSVIKGFDPQSTNLAETAISWHEERTKILEENTQLQTTLKSAQDRLAFTEKNADVFKDQYLRASSFVADLRTENAELQERTEVAESQANTGIASVHAMYEMRVKQLEEESLYHKRVTTFLIEQTQRTQDEDIRRRAADHPELERRYVELEDKYSDLEGMLDGARGVIDTFEKQVTLRDKENEVLRTEKRTIQEGIQEEMDRLRRELEDSRREVDKLKSERAVNPSEDAMTPPTNGTVEMTNAKQEKVGGDVQVYRCLWRKNGIEHCDAIFLTQKALGQHLEFGGHIQ